MVLDHGDNVSGAMLRNIIHSGGERGWESRDTWHRHEEQAPHSPAGT